MIDSVNSILKKLSDVYHLFMVKGFIIYESFLTSHGIKNAYLSTYRKTYLMYSVNCKNEDF